MDPEKKEELDRLREDRARVIGELRNQYKLGNFKDVLLALVSLQEVQLRLEQWEEQNEKAASA